MNEHHNMPDESESHAALGSSEIIPITDQIADYRLEDRIGGGRFGQIFHASHNRLRRNVAIRILAAEAVADPTTTQQFLREMRTLALVEHSNLVRCRKAGSTGLCRQRAN